MKIDIKPTAKQFEAWNALDPISDEYRFVLFGGGANGGKSWLGCEWLLTMSLAFPNTRWLMARNELRKLKQTTLVTFFKVCRFHGVKKDVHFKYATNGSAIKFSNGSEIVLMDLKFRPSDPEFDELGSLELTGAFVDEVAEIHFKGFDVLKTRIGRHLNGLYNIVPKLLMSCNPTKNWVYKTFYKPHKEGSPKPKHKFIQALITDNPKREKGSLEQLQLIQSKPTKERLLYGNWEFEDDPAKLCEYEDLLDLFSNSFVKRTGVRYITADLATHGSDLFVICVWDGWVLIHTETAQKADAKQIEEKIRKIAKRFKVARSNIAYDSDGLGNYLRGYLKGAEFIINGSKPRSKAGQKPPNFYNLRAQLHYNFSEIVNNKSCYLPLLEPEEQEAIVEELEQTLKDAEPDKDGKKKTPKKEKIKTILGRSPDWSDALVMRCIFDLPKSNKGKIKAFGVV